MRVDIARQLATTRQDMNLRTHSKTMGMIGGQAVFNCIAFQFFQYIHQLFTNWAKQTLDFDFVKDVLGIIAIIGASIFGYALLAQLVENEPYPTMPVNKRLGNQTILTMVFKSLTDALIYHLTSFWQKRTKG